MRLRRPTSAEAQEAPATGLEGARELEAALAIGERRVVAREGRLDEVGVNRRTGWCVDELPRVQGVQWSHLAIRSGPDTNVEGTVQGVRAGGDALLGPVAARGEDEHRPAAPRAAEAADLRQAQEALATGLDGARELEAALAIGERHVVARESFLEEVLADRLRTGWCGDEVPGVQGVQWSHLAIRSGPDTNGGPQGSLRKGER